MIDLYIVIAGLIAFYFGRPRQSKWKKIDADTYVIVFILCMLIGWMMLPYDLVSRLYEKCRK